MAGNPSAHLPAQAYNFRAATGTNVSGTPQQTTSSTAVGIVILIVSLTVFCTLAAGIGTIKLWRSHANKLKAYLPQEGAGRRKPAQSAPISIPVPETTKPAYDKSASASPFAEEKARAETAYRSAAAAAERLGKDAGSNSANSANSESKPASGATWAQRPGSKTGPSPSPKVHPGFNAGRNRRSTPPPAGEGGGLMDLQDSCRQRASISVLSLQSRVRIPCRVLSRFQWWQQGTRDFGTSIESESTQSSVSSEFLASFCWQAPASAPAPETNLSPEVRCRSLREV